MSFISKIFDNIKSSIFDVTGKISHTKISSYFILCIILLTNVVYLGIDCVNAFSLWRKGEIYKIPTEHIVIFSLILTHHLVLLGLKNASEVKSLELYQPTPTPPNEPVVPIDDVVRDGHCDNDIINDAVDPIDESVDPVDESTESVPEITIKYKNKKR